MRLWRGMSKATLPGVLCIKCKIDIFIPLSIFTDDSTIPPKQKINNDAKKITARYLLLLMLSKSNNLKSIKNHLVSYSYLQNSRAYQNFCVCALVCYKQPFLVRCRSQCKSMTQASHVLALTAPLNTKPMS